MLAEGSLPEQSAATIVDSITQTIDSYWENVLQPPQNSLRITFRGSLQSDGSVIQEIYTIQRIFNTAYYIKCQRSALESAGADSIFNSPLDIIEFRLEPLLFEKNMINIRQINPQGLTFQEDVTLENLNTKNSLALEILEHLLSHLLATLARRTKIFEGG